MTNPDSTLEAELDNLVVGILADRDYVAMAMSVGTKQNPLPIRPKAYDAYMKRHNKIKSDIKTLFTQYVERAIGEDDVQDWDSENSACYVCNFQATDDTAHCICYYRNQLRAELRTSLTQYFKGKQDA